MECQEAKAKMFSYFDQELSLQEEEAFFDHLSLCTNCGLEFSSVEETHHLLQETLIPVAPPLDLTERIMARIPLPQEQPAGTFNAFGLRAKQYLADIGNRWKDALGSWQLRSAVVTMGVLAFVVFGNLSNIFEPQIPQKQTPGTNVALVDPVDKEDQTQAGGKTSGENTPSATDVAPKEDQEPNNDGAKSPVGEDSGQTGGKTPEGAPEVADNPTKVVPDSNTNVVELPHAASGDNRIETIEVVSLVESNGQNASHPVLAEDGQYIHYLYDNAGVEEEWQIELKPGALPEKAQSNLILGVDQELDSSIRIPEWLSEIEMVKEAKSKSVAWSSDKKQLAVNLNSVGTDNDGLWIAQSDGSTLAHAAQEGGGNDLVWSPDQMKIAFTDGSNNLYVLYLRENLLIQVTDASESITNLGHLFWTSDGQELIFDGVKSTDGTTGIFRVRLP